MLKGKINKIEFMLEAGKATTADPYVKELLETLEGTVYNPQTGKTYNATSDNDMDAYLLISQLAIETSLEIVIDDFQLLESMDEPGKLYN